MAPKDCYAADSAGVILSGNVAVLTFMSTGYLDQPHDAVLLSQDSLRELYESIGTELRRQEHGRHPTPREGGGPVASEAACV